MTPNEVNLWSDGGDGEYNIRPPFNHDPISPQEESDGDLGSAIEFLAMLGIPTLVILLGVFVKIGYRIVW